MYNVWKTFHKTSQTVFFECFNFVRFYVYENILTVRTSQIMVTTQQDNHIPVPISKEHKSVVLFHLRFKDALQMHTQKLSNNISNKHFGITQLRNTSKRAKNFKNVMGHTCKGDTGSPPQQQA